MVSVIEKDELDKKIFKIIYEGVTFKWEKLDIKLFQIISNSFPLAFAVHNDFMDKDRDKTSYDKFINTYKCFITVYKVRKSLIKEKIEKEYISLLIDNEFFNISFGTYWYLLFGKYEQLNYMWNSICNFSNLEERKFESFLNPYIEKNFINNETSIVIPKQESTIIASIKNLLTNL